MWLLLCQFPATVFLLFFNYYLLSLCLCHGHPRCLVSSLHLMYRHYSMLTPSSFSAKLKKYFLLPFHSEFIHYIFCDCYFFALFSFVNHWKYWFQNHIKKKKNIKEGAHFLGLPLHLLCFPAFPSTVFVTEDNSQRWTEDQLPVPVLDRRLMKRKALFHMVW